MHPLSFRQNNIVRCLLSGILLAAVSGFAQTVSVTLPELTASPGQSLLVDVTAGYLTGRGVYAFDMTLSYDADRLIITDVSTDGALTSGWGPPTWLAAAGQLKVGMGGSDPLSGSGVLIRFQLRVSETAPTGVTVPLTWIRFQWNEGNPQAEPVNGSIRIQPDTAPPVFTQPLQVQNITTHSARLIWQTDEPARCQIHYGLTGSDPELLVFDNFQTNRQVTLSGLQSAATYTVWVECWDNQNNGPSSSSMQSFTTETIRLQLTSVTGDPGTQVSVPVMINDATGQDVRAMDWDIVFPAEWISFVGIETYGALTAGWDPPVFSSSGSEVQVQLSGGYALGGSGTVAQMKFFIKSAAQVGTDADLIWKTVQINGGAVPVLTQNGILQIRDTQPPVISIPELSIVDPFSVRIRWTTDEPATGAVNYGPAGGPLSNRVESAVQNTVHEFHLTGLTGEQGAAFQVDNTDIHGNGPVFGPVQLFQTPQIEGPRLQVDILELHSNETGTLTIHLDGKDNEPVYRAGCILELNPEWFEIVSLDLADNLSATWQMDEQVTGQGFAAVWISGNPVSGTLPLFTVAVSLRSGVTGDHDRPVFIRRAEINGIRSGTENGWIQVRSAVPDPLPEWIIPPVLEFPASDRVRVRWMTTRPGCATVAWTASGGASQSIETVQSGQWGEADLTDLVPGETLDLTLLFHDENGASLSYQLAGIPVPAAGSVRCTVPDMQQTTGQTFSWPVSVTDVTGLAVFSLDMSLRYDPDVLDFVSADSRNTLTAGWGDPVITSESGVVRIAMGGVQPLAGKGQILQLNFRVKGAEGRESMIFSDFFRLNEGEPAAVFSGGRLTVSDTADPALRSGPEAVRITDTGALVVWETDEPADTEILFGETGTLNRQIRTTELEQCHVAPLEALTPDREISCQIAGADAAGNRFDATMTPFHTKPDQSVQFLLNPLSGDAGDVMELLVNVLDWPGEPVWSISMEITFSTGMLEYTETQPGPALAGWSVSESQDNSRITLQITGSSPVSGEGHWITVGFKCLASAPLNQEQPVGIGAVRLNGRPVSVQGAATTFTRIDRTPPGWVITPLFVYEDPDSIALYWETDEPVTTEIRYGALSVNEYTAVMPNLFAINWMGWKPHAGNLLARAGVTDAAGNGPVWSGTVSFTPAAEPAVALKLNDQAVPMGEAVSIPVLCEQTNSGIRQFELTLLIPGGLSFVSADHEQTLTRSWPAARVEKSGRELTISQSGPALTEAGPLFNLRFEVTDSLPHGIRQMLILKNAAVNNGELAVQRRSSVITFLDQTLPEWVSGPEFAMITAYDAILAWETTEPCRGSLFYRRPGQTSQEIALQDMTAAHQVRVSGLESSTRYEVQIRLWDAAGNGPLTSDWLPFTTRSDTVELSLPHILAPSGEAVDIPVEVSQLTGLDVRSVHLVIGYPEDFIVSGVSFNGTLASGWSSPSLGLGPSSLTIQASGEPLEGEGILLWLQGIPSAAAGTMIPLNLEYGTLNNGRPVSRLSSGSVRVIEGGGPGIRVSLPDTVVQAGMGLDIPVRITDCTGRGIYSLQGRLDYDPDFVEIEGLRTDSALTARWQVTQTVNDSLTFSLTGNSALQGAGVLFMIRLTVSDSSPDSLGLHWVRLQCNQGRPAVSFSDGWIRPSRSVSISGIVRNTTQSPIAGAMVFLLNSDTGALTSMETGSDGRFRFTDVDSAVTYTLWASANLYVPSSPVPVSAGMHDLQIVLEKAEGMISGWVRSEIQGLPVPDALVTIADASETHFYSANTDSGGYFQFSDLPGQTVFQALVSKFGFHEATVSNLIPDTTLVIILQPVRAILTGVVTGSGLEAGGIPVLAQSLTQQFTDSARTDTRGVFRLNLPIDTYLIYPNQPGTVSIPPQIEIALNLEPGDSLRFTVKPATLKKIDISGPVKIKNTQSVTYRLTALSDSGEVMRIGSVQWNLDPPVSGLVFNGQVTPLSIFLGPANLTAREPVSGISDTLRLSILAPVHGQSAQQLRDETGFVLRFPAGCVSVPADIELSRPDLPAFKRSTRQGVQTGSAYQLFPEGIQFEQPVFLGFPSEADAVESWLKPAVWNTENGAWDLLPASAEGDTLISTLVDHFSLFSLISVERTFGLDLECVPNPFSPLVDTDGDGYPGLSLHITARARHADQPWITLEIYNTLGQRVRSLMHGETLPNGEKVLLHWDGLTDQGFMARNGRYLIRAVLEDGKNKKETLQSAILIK